MFLWAGRTGCHHPQPVPPCPAREEGRLRDGSQVQLRVQIPSQTHSDEAGPRPSQEYEPTSQGPYQV